VRLAGSGRLLKFACALATRSSRLILSGVLTQSGLEVL
jgi:hypothetical protein